MNEHDEELAIDAVYDFVFPCVLEGRIGDCDRYLAELPADSLTSVLLSALTATSGIKGELKNRRRIYELVSDRYRDAGDETRRSLLKGLD